MTNITLTVKDDNLLFIEDSSGKVVVRDIVTINDVDVADINDGIKDSGFTLPYDGAVEITRIYKDNSSESASIISIGHLVSCFLAKQKKEIDDILAKGCSGACVKSSWELDLLAAAIILINNWLTPDPETNTVPEEDSLKALDLIKKIASCGALCSGVLGNLDKGCGCHEDYS